MLMVALNHSTLATVGFMRGPVGAAGPERLGDRLVEMFFQNITPLSLPMFIFASGYYAARFHQQWASALASARTTTIRYLIWSISGYAILAIAHRHLDLLDTLHGLVTNGPFSAYWFLVMFIEMTLITPLLSRLVTRSPWLALSVAIAAQAFSSFLTYRGLAGSPEFLNPHTVPRNLSPFLLGMLFSIHSSTITPRLEKRRTWLMAGAVVFFAVSLAETVALSQAFGDGTIRTYSYDVGRASFVLCSLFSIGAIVTAAPKYPRIRSYLDWLGARSLALLLLLDPVLTIAVWALWHANDLIHFKFQHTTIPPVWTQGTWTTVPLLVTGLLIPLLTVELVGHWGGKNAKKFLFG